VRNKAANLRVDRESSNRRQPKFASEFGNDRGLIDEYRRRMNEHRVHFGIDRTSERPAKINGLMDTEPERFNPRHFG
jgi:hypothetical protein